MSKTPMRKSGGSLAEVGGGCGARGAKPLKSLAAEVGGGCGTWGRKPLKSLAEVGGSRTPINPLQGFMKGSLAGGEVALKKKRAHRFDENIVAEMLGWTLVSRPQASTEEWGSFRLLRQTYSTAETGRKWSYYLGHNGNRMARSSDAAALMKRWPDVFKWAEREMKRNRANV